MNLRWRVNNKRPPASADRPPAAQPSIFELKSQKKKNLNSGPNSFISFISQAFWQMARIAAPTLSRERLYIQKKNPDSIRSHVFEIQTHRADWHQRIRDEDGVMVETCWDRLTWVSRTVKKIVKCLAAVPNLFPAFMFNEYL